MPVRPKVLEALSSFSTPAVSNAIETFKIRLRHEGYMDSSIHSRTAPSHAMAGYAITMQMRTDAPPMRGLSYEDRSDWWESLTAYPKPRILVIQDVGGVAGKGSVCGETHAAIFKALGCVGIVTNGSVRDLEAMEKMHLHVYSGSLSPSHAYAHIVDIGKPVKIGGIEIKNGALLHGDRHGIITIPEAIADKLPVAIESALGQEKAVIDLCASEDFSIDKLRTLIASLNGALGGKG